MILIIIDVSMSPTLSEINNKNKDKDQKYEKNIYRNLTEKGQQLKLWIKQASTKVKRQSRNYNKLRNAHKHTCIRRKK